jgi:hypothetical protein
METATKHIVTFGKYKGRPLNEMLHDANYCKWLIEQNWFARAQPETYEILVRHTTPPTSPSPTPPTTSRLAVKRSGKDITKTVPKPVVLIDTREQRPFTFERFSNWIERTELRSLKTGDYSILGMENLICLERKGLADLILTLIHNRARFLDQCERMLDYLHRAIIVEASYEDLKTPYPDELQLQAQSRAGIKDSRLHTRAHPNGVTGTLDAVEARFGINILYTSRRRELSEERAASWLSKHFTYHWLETNGKSRVLQEGDF